MYRMSVTLSSYFYHIGFFGRILLVISGSDRPVSKWDAADEPIVRPSRGR